MTVKELKSLLDEVSNQEKEICEEDILTLVYLDERRKSIEGKIAELKKENVNKLFVDGWENELIKTNNQIINY